MTLAGLNGSQQGRNPRQECRMHIFWTLSIRFTSQKEVDEGKGALRVFIEKPLGSQENLAMETCTLLILKLD